MPTLPQFYDDTPDDYQRYQHNNPSFGLRAAGFVGRAATKAAKAYAAKRITDWMYSKYSGGSAGGASQGSVNFDGSLSQLTQSQSDTMPTLGGTKRSGSETQSARSVVARISGGVSSQTHLVPSMFIPGRGAEVPYNQDNYMQPLKHAKFKVGGSVKDAYYAQRKAWAPTKVSQQFAFRAFLALPSTTSFHVNNDSQTVPTRFVVHNVFRHKFGSMCSSLTNSTTTDWNATLGPDSTYVRKPPPNGTWPGTPATVSLPANPAAISGFNNELVSPARQPFNKHYMYSTLTKQLLENMSWNMNPHKIIGVRSLNTDPNDPYQYPNAPIWNRNSIYNAVNATSYAYLQPIDPTVAGFKSNSTFKTQLGGGYISYTFCNDSSTPVVVDIVIHSVKQGTEIDAHQLRGFQQQSTVTANSGGDLIENLYADGYATMTKQGSDVLAYDANGRQPIGTDCLYDSKTPFMPKTALKLAKAGGLQNPLGYSTSRTMQTHPLTQSGRDQFIIAAGAQRSWSVPLCPLVYMANHYQQGINPLGTGGEDPIHNDTKILDDCGVILSLGFSSMAAPTFETSQLQATLGEKVIIDRNPGPVNVRVTGNYTEKIAPSIMDYRNPISFIDGAADRVKFGGAVPNQSLHQGTILDASQLTRSTTSSEMHLGPSSSGL